MNDPDKEYEFSEVVGSEKLIRNLNQNNMKKWYQSKTVWFNVVVFVVAFLALPEFVRLLPPSLLPYDVLGGVVGNLVLRLFFTNTGIN